MMFARSGRPAGRHARDRRWQSDPQPVRADEPEPVADPSGAQAPQRSGPFDLSEAPAGHRVDLGSLQLPVVPGVQLRVQANSDGVIARVALVHGDSALQLGAFAAPRSEGIWDEVRAEIHAAMVADGAEVTELRGQYGVELWARAKTPEGPRNLRVVGVDGPRWMLRADFHGPAAVNPTQAAALTECLRGLVVNRGDEARPVREPLPLRLPPESAQIQPQQLPPLATDAAGPDAPGPARRAFPPPHRRT